ncbi:MAG: HAD hydrolase-like protein [Acidobacteriota bacterium]
MSRVAISPAAVLFDLDGTLADSGPAIARALNRALREQGLAEQSREWVRRHVGRGAAALVRDAVGRPEEDLVGTVGASYSRHYRAIYLDQTRPIPGAREVLSFVAAGTGGRVGVVSNKDSLLCNRWLRQWGLAGFVAVVSGPDVSGARKPDPRALLPVLQALDVTPGSAVLVGDMVIDVAAGAAAGVGVIAVQGGGSTAGELRDAGALVALHELRDLPPWLAGNGHGWQVKQAISHQQSALSNQPLAGS